MVKIMLASALLVSPLVDEATPPSNNEVTLEDKNQNGIPDSIEDYYDQHIRDQYAFGISLGSIIGFGTSLIGWLTIHLKNKKTSKFITTQVDDLKKQVTDMKEEFEKYYSFNKEVVAKNNELTNENRILAEKIILSNNEVTIALNQYKDIDDKINTIVNNQLIFSSYSEFVKENIGTKVNRLTENLYGKK